MVNKTKFYKTKVALAVVLSLGLAACGDSDGDEGSTSTSVSDATQNSTSEQHALTGTVSGKVQDTNGRPVAGAMVYFMGKETTTDAGGNYVFADVLVTNLNGNNDNGTGNEADEIPSSLTVTITGPAGYLSAVVNVTPQAVVNNTGTNTADGGSADVTASTFIDGFAAEAGVAVIAEENSMVTGYLRIGNATPAAGETVYLDFTGYSSTNTTLAGSAGGTAGAAVTITPGEYSAVTAADGSFTFENVPADSAFVLGVKGKTITTADTDTTSNGSNNSGNGAGDTDGAITVATPFEQDENFVGTFEIIDNEFAVEVDAEYNPWVASVNGVLNPTVGVGDTGGTDENGDTVTYGDLDEGINKEITINFSEPLNTTKFDVTKVKVAEVGGSGTYFDVTPTLSPDGLSLTVVFAEELAPGTKFTVFISQASSIDEDGNALNVVRNVTNASVATNPAPYTTGSDTVIVFDDLNDVTTKANYIEVNLCTFLDGNAGVEGATAAQVFDESTTFDAGTIGLQGYSDAFRDAEDSEVNGGAVNNLGGDIAQLNGQEAQTSAKLKALGDAVLTVIGDGELLDEVDADFPWITVKTGDAASYSINKDVKKADDSVITANTVINASSNSVNFGDDHGVDGVVDGQSSASVKVTFMDDFGVADASETVTLIDALPPVTVLQENYNLYSVTGYDQILSTAGEANYGDGGEVVNDGLSATAGNPLIWIQPRHLQQKGLNNAAPSRSATNTYGSLTNLSARVDTDENASDMDGSTFIQNRPTYDATAYTAWAAIPVTNEIGVDFSENIALTTAAPSTSGISTGLSGYLANNNVLKNVDNDDVHADLVQVTVANVMTLANVDNTGFIDFVAAVRDTSTSENVATAATNAKVIFRDAMPPLMTNATWNGTNLTMVFNEAVTFHPTDTTSVTLVHPNSAVPDVSVTLDPTVVATAHTGFTLSDDKKTVVVNTTGLATIAGVFAGDITANDPTVDEYFYDDGGNSTADDQHTLIRWDRINDANGNNWNTFTVNGPDADGSQAASDTTFAERYQVEAPQFLAVNELGAFTVAPQNIIGLDANGNLDVDGNFTLTLDFTHPIDVDLFDGADDIIQETELAGLFYFDIDNSNTRDSAGADANPATLSDNEDIEPAIDDISISNNNQRITISIDRDNNQFTVGNAYIRMSTDVVSSFIATETVQQDFNIRN